MTAAPAGARDCKGNFAGYVRMILPDTTGRGAPALGVIGHIPLGGCGSHRQYSLDSAPSGGINIITHRACRPGEVHGQDQAPPPKVAALRECRTLNPRPERVTDPLFREQPSSTPAISFRSSTRCSAACGWTAARHRAPRRSASRGPPSTRPRRPSSATGSQGSCRAARAAARAQAAPESSSSSKRRSRRIPLCPRRSSPRVQERFGVTVHPRSMERALGAAGKKTAVIAALVAAPAATDRGATKSSAEALDGAAVGGAGGSRAPARRARRVDAARRPAAAERRPPACLPRRSVPRVPPPWARLASMALGGEEMRA